MALPLHPVCLPSVSLVRTLVIELRAHLSNVGLSHLEILDLMTSAKAHLPNKITFTGSRGENVDLPLRGHHLTHYAS